MAGFNPCYCWNLKDGCVTVGIWTLAFSLTSLAIFSWQTAIFSLTQLSLFGWQTYVLTQCRVILFHDFLNCQDYCPCARNRNVKTTQDVLQAYPLQVLSIIQMAIFGWQTAIIKFERDKTANRRLPSYWGYSIYDNRMGGGDWTEYYVTPEEKFYTGLFVIQILNLIAAFFLLFGSVSLIYGIHTSSKYLVWPWFPCIAAAIICSLAYCVMWWVGDVQSYWLVLTIVEVISVFINLYCLFCVVIQYRRIVRGYVQASEDDSVKNQQLIGYDDYRYRPGDTGVITYAPEKKVGEGVWNVMYEPEGTPQTRVHVYGKDAYGRPITAPNELVAYSQEPLRGAGPYDDPMSGAQQETEFPCSRSERTEEWLKDVMQSHPEEPKIPILDHPPSPGKERPYSRSRSLDALEKEGRDKGRRSMRSAKSKDSVSSKHSRHGRRDSSSCSTCTSSSSETEEGTRKGRSRSEGRHRRRDSDSEDTGYSRSALDSTADKKHKKHRHQHHHHREHRGDHHHRHGHHKHHKKHKDKSDDDRRSRKRLRDVKREDKERRLQQQQKEDAKDLEPPQAPIARPETSSSTDRSRVPPGAVPVFPFGSGAAAQPGAISIPQHIVIPPQPKGAPHQPQRFHINSEITISYSDRSAPGSDSEHRPPSGGPLRPTPPGAAPPAAVLPAVTSGPSFSPARQQTPPIPPPRNGSGTNRSSNSPADTSGDSKGYGSTAV